MELAFCQNETSVNMMGVAARLMTRRHFNISVLAQGFQRQEYK